jgi:thiosulfate dehydrogenase [quinone] large subunit
MKDRSMSFLGDHGMTGTMGERIGMLILRLILGGAFLEAGLEKLINGFSAEEYLEHGTGPLAGWFAGLTGGTIIINGVVIWGEILIGLALILGLLLRPASIAGAAMMVLYYLPYLPPSSGWINNQMVYMFIFIALMLSGVGYFLGLDRYFISLEEKRSPFRFLFG